MFSVFDLNFDLYGLVYWFYEAAPAPVPSLEGSSCIRDVSALPAVSIGPEDFSFDSEIPVPDRARAPTPQAAPPSTCDVCDSEARRGQRSVATRPESDGHFFYAVHVTGC